MSVSYKHCDTDIRCLFSACLCILYRSLSKLKNKNVFLAYLVGVHVCTWEGARVRESVSDLAKSIHTCVCLNHGAPPRRWQDVAGALTWEAGPVRVTGGPTADVAAGDGAGGTAVSHQTGWTRHVHTGALLRAWLWGCWGGGDS